MAEPPFILVGVSGSIAAYKAVLLVRELIAAGCEVQVIPTRASLEFVGAATWEALTGHVVTDQVFAGSRRVEHVELARRARVAVVAPASADILAKMACGLGDDLLTTTLLACTCPVIVAPAMHTAMWLHPATQANISVLSERGVRVVGPAEGRLTSGDTGTGRMSEPSEIAAAVTVALAADQASAAADMAGLRVVVSAGGTHEPLDPVRYLANRSSGKQGVALAQEALARGAQVTLVAGALEVTAPVDANVRRVETALEMERAVRAACAEADVVVMAAAVGDFRPSEAQGTKIKKRDPGEPIVLTLIPNPDILAGLVREPPREGLTIVGFAAETAGGDADVLALGRQKARRKGADLLVINEVGPGVGMGTDTNCVTMVDQRGDIVRSASGSKRDVAAAIWDEVLALRSAQVR